MMLGKRARHPMKRTTSMTEFSFDDLSILNHSPSDQLPPVNPEHHHRINQNNQNQRLMAMVSPRPINRRNSADFATTITTSNISFLATCSLCNRRLAPGRDIYMYRGDSAFCSLECRQQQMAQDERREQREKDEKKKINNNKNNHCSSSLSLAKESNPTSQSPHHSHSHSSPAGSHVSSATTPETIAAL